MKSRPCAATSAHKPAHTAKSIVLVVSTLLMAGALPAQAQTSGNIPTAKTVPAIKTPGGPSAAEVKSKASYSLGVSFGTQLHGYGVTANSVTYERVLQGLKDALAGKAVAGPEDGQRVQNLIELARTTEGAANQAAADKFLAENGKLPGVVTTASGLQYKILRQGSGEPPKATDEVTVNYTGSLLNGTVFDSSYKRNQPLVTPLSGLIKGWSEALLLMKPGSKVELYIPPALGYGANSPPPIPPDSLLKFQVELLSFKPASAASARPAPGGAPAAPRHP